MDYQQRTKKIIKWYEYNMSLPQTASEDANEETIPEPSEEIMSYTEAIDTMNEMVEEIDEEALAASGLDESEQALVADIMARFKDAKQNSVDDLFKPAQMSEEELIASICAPKQGNVDAFVKQAKEQ